MVALKKKILCPKKPKHNQKLYKSLWNWNYNNKSKGRCIIKKYIYIFLFLYVKIEKMLLN